jgi:hypothetical protein
MLPWKSVTAGWLALLGLSSTTATSAAAARRPEVAVIGVHVDGQDIAASELAGNTLAAALEESAKIDVLGIEQVRVRLAGRESLVLEAAFLGPGRTRLEEGGVLYERADFESAAEVLELAIPALEDGCLGTTDIKDLLDALLLFGLAQFGLGEPEAAAVPWARLVELDPNRQLDPVNYPPKVVQGFEEVRDKVLAKDQGALVIDAPDGASVVVDGRRTDERSMKLVPGIHFVVVQDEDGGRQADRVDIGSGRKMVWSAALLTRISGGGEGQAELLYRALGEHLDVDFVLVAGAVGEDQVGMQLYEPRTDSFSKIVKLDMGDDAVGSLTDGVPTLANYLGEAGTLRPDRVDRKVLSVDLATNPLLTEVLLDPMPVGEVREVTKAAPWYLWAGVAVAAAGGAAGLAIALQPEEAPQPTGDGGGGGGPGETGPPVDPNQGVILIEIP